MTGSLDPRGGPAGGELRSGSGMSICPKCRTTYSSSALPRCYRDGELLIDYERFLASERDPLRGVVIGGKYRLVERIGQGGMGTIYRAVQAGLNRPVAVKILKRELNVDPDTVARFHREANAMSHLTHPNTVRVYDFGQTDDGLLYLVMELLEGERITDVMAREPLDVALAVRITQEILRSLAEAHSRGIVHRDLKPDNLFLARVEGHAAPVIKVLDFGIAKVVAPDRRVDQFETQAGTVFGTPRYMSPEQAQGARLDNRSDLYSVGALLYQLLVGHPPFTDEDAVVVMAKHIQELPEAPRLAVPERPIPRSLDDVVMRALAKQPASRFQQATAFALALEACLPDVVAASEAAATGRWPQRPAQRWLGWSYALLTLVLLGAGYFGVRVYTRMNVAGSARSEVGASAAASSDTGPNERPRAAGAMPPGQRATGHRSAQASHGVASAGRSSASARAVDVTVRSVPSGARVFRDARLLGKTPLKLRIRAHEQFVRIELQHAGYQPLAAELTAQDGTRLLTLTATRSRKSASRQDQADGARIGGDDVEPTTNRSGPYERFE